MTLLEICEPIFLEVSKLSRLSRSCIPGATPPRLGFVAVRTRFEDLFREAERKANSEPVVAGQFQLVKGPLVFFVDDVLKNSQLPFAGEWAEKTLEQEWFTRLVGADRFFDRQQDSEETLYETLEETLKKPGVEAEERLKVFCTCLGLGFAGRYRGDADRLQDWVDRLRARLRSVFSQDPTDKVCPEAYNVDPRNLWKRPTEWVKWVVAGFVVLSVAMLVFYCCLFAGAKEELSKVLKDINRPAGTHASAR